MNRYKMQAELAEENTVMMNNIYHSLNKFLEEFNSDYRYSMILTTSGGAPILHADPLLDITDLVVDGLNAQYAKDKKGGTSATDLAGDTAPAAGAAN